MIARKTTVVELTKDEVSAAITQYVRCELSGDGQYFEELEITSEVLCVTVEAKTTEEL